MGTEVMPDLERDDAEIDENKAELLRYIEDAQQKLRQKTELYSRNHSAAKLRPDPSVLAKLDSSLKKNSAFVRKLRNFTCNQLDGLIKDMAVLNLSKYLSEVAAALVDVKLKVTDVPSVVSLCSELHALYADFSSILFEYWARNLMAVKRGEMVSNPSKLRVDLRIYADLLVCGVFAQREALPVLITTLGSLTSPDKDSHRNINIINSFCKHCGDDFAGLVPQRIRFLSECYGIDVPRSNLLPLEKQENIRSLLKEYYTSICEHLIKVHANVKYFESQNKKILLMKGEVQEERIRKTEELQTELHALLSSAQSFSQLIDESLPNLPERDDSKDGEDTAEMIGALWEDEESRRFYQEFPNLHEYLPAAVPQSRQFPAQPQMTEEKLDEELKDEDFMVDDPQKEDNIAEPDDTDTTANRAQLDAFLSHLPQCVNKEMIDNAALEFLITLNSRAACRKLVKALFNVHRTRLDLLPFYGRIVAILNPALPDVACSLVHLLKQDFKYHINKKDQVNVESKVKVIRFIGELVKFELYPKIEALYCLKVLLHDFTHHHIEMTCNLLETCGRFLYRSPDTHQRTKIYLELMMRLKTANSLDIRYSNLIENTFYYVNPPDRQLLFKKSRPPVHEFLRKTIFQDLMHPGFEKQALKILRSVNWECNEVADYAIKCLVSAWKIKYHRIPTLANLIAGIVEYQEFVGSRVVDGVLEDIRLGMEVNRVNLNQRRVAMIKYYGELYNYRLIDSNDVFKVLYSLITFGVSTDKEAPSVLDPPESLFRIRLVLVLLETCASFFTNSDSKMKLTYFFTFFQNYYWFKRSLPIWDESKFPITMEYQFLDALHVFCPCLATCMSYEESQVAVKSLTDKLMEGLKMKTIQELEMSCDANNGRLQPILETSENNETETDDYPVEMYRNELEEDDEDIIRIVNRIELQQLHEVAMQDEDMEFLSALDQMVTDDVQDRAKKDTVRPSTLDISVPLATRKRYPSTDKNSNFILITRKGNKQQCKSLTVPEDSDLVMSIKSHEEAERREMEEVKQLTLDINERLQEEENQWWRREGSLLE